ncbi:MAG: hypothetical protein F6K24_03530 [Okeania sp. SIO2D1]|nr:hypothetical protein [Okeania sp. SIO2D1]
MTNYDTRYIQRFSNCAVDLATYHAQWIVNNGYQLFLQGLERHYRATEELFNVELLIKTMMWLYWFGYQYNRQPLLPEFKPVALLKAGEINDTPPVQPTKVELELPQEEDSTPPDAQETATIDEEAIAIFKSKSLRTLASVNNFLGNHGVTLYEARKLDKIIQDGKDKYRYEILRKDDQILLTYAKTISELKEKIINYMQW